MEALILLVGNPNAGKSTLFNRLTRGHARVGNWHGVTVDALESPALPPLSGTVVDLPGLYNAGGKTLEEKHAARYLAEHKDASLLFVCEYANLARFVPLMCALTASPRRAALVLTKRKLFTGANGSADVAKIGSRLGIPAFDAEDKMLASRLAAALSAPALRVRPAPLDGIYRPAEEGLSRADRLLLSPKFALPFFALLLLCAFFLTFARGMPGDLLKSLIERGFGVLAALAEGIPSPIVCSLAGELARSVGSVLAFLPQVLLLQLFLILLEESGLLSRLAVLTDGALGKIGLSGRAVFSLLMGFGCTAAAILSTRGLDDKRMQRRVILCLPYVSCSAKLPVYLALSASFFESPFFAVLLLYALGAGIGILVAFLTKGETPAFAMELAPLQRPNAIFVAKALLFHAKQFIIKVGTVILAFFLVSWFLSSFDVSMQLCTPSESLLAKFCGVFDWVFAPIGMRDWRITYAALSGLVAKENVAGTLAMLVGDFPYSAASAFAFAVFILTCSPCVSAIAASAREVGPARALLYALLETASALLFCDLVYFLLGSLALALPVLIAAAAGILLYERIHRQRTHHAQSVHRRDLSAGVGGTARAPEGTGRARQRRKGGRRPPAREGGQGELLHDARAGGVALAHRRLFGRVRSRRG